MQISNDEGQFGGNYYFLLSFQKKKKSFPVLSLSPSPIVEFHEGALFSLRRILKDIPIVVLSIVIKAKLI